MSRFTCRCGATFGGEEGDAPSGVLFPLRALKRASQALGAAASALAALPPRERGPWLEGRLGQHAPDQPLEDSFDELFELELSDRGERPAFVCPQCRRLALARPDGEWDFYSPE